MDAAGFGAMHTQPTFKARVEHFWHWYAQVAERFYKMLENDNDEDVVAETSDKVDELFPGFAWVYGPGEAGLGEPGRSFTLSGEGLLQIQLLALYWLSRAPVLEGWTFYASRQPSAPEIIETMRINFEGQELDPLEFWLTPTADDEEEKVNLTVWHPLYAGVPENEARVGAFWVFLDEVLGEYGTSQWIGQVTRSLLMRFRSPSFADLSRNWSPKKDGKSFCRENAEWITNVMTRKGSFRAMTWQSATRHYTI
jgi:hypothetical protein